MNLFFRIMTIAMAKLNLYAGCLQWNSAKKVRTIGHMIGQQFMLENATVKNADDCLFILNSQNEQSFEIGSKIETTAAEGQLKSWDGTYEKISDDYITYK